MWSPGGALGKQRQHDVAAVVVGEHLAGRRDLGMTAEHSQVVLGADQLVDRNREHVVGDRLDGVLVEIVADPRPVAEQVLDRDGFVDQWEVGAEQGPSGRVQRQHATLDQSHHHQRREALGATGDRGTRRGVHRHRPTTVGESNRPVPWRPSGQFEPDQSCEALAGEQGVDLAVAGRLAHAVRRYTSTTSPFGCQLSVEVLVQECDHLGPDLGRQVGIVRT